jgi:exopolysaccharide biosynthesis polyprenyl glycosylphosphotransferase
MNNKARTFTYILTDFIAAAGSWALFYAYRKVYIESPVFGIKVPLDPDLKFWLSLLIVPLFWILLHSISGYYRNPYRKSRLQELGQTFLFSLIGVLILFFTLILDDTIPSYRSYYLSISVLFFLQFFLTYIPRVFITTATIQKIRSGKIGFNTLLIGGNKRALEIYTKLTAIPKSSGNKIVGFISINAHPSAGLEKHIPKLGTLKDVDRIIDEYEIEEVIIAIESGDYETLGKMINNLNKNQVIIKAVPVLYDILTGRVKMSSVYGTPLIEISHDLIPYWQSVFKQAIDYFVSAVALILTFPLCIILAIIIKFSTPGPVIFIQERIGRFGKPFKLYKFRTMFMDAEEYGPTLSTTNDPRITPIGQFMRKTRLDEIPNFVNVMIGDMSLVGPRPERKYYVDQILKVAPHYVHLQKVKPGITSWGQVKFGYAENIDQMVERLNYDLIYIENMSLYVDLKIIIYTVLTVIGARGK